MIVLADREFLINLFMTQVKPFAHRRVEKKYLQSILTVKIKTF